jgi:formiminotetrahydrofolate cyclodeaminase
MVAGLTEGRKKYQSVDSRVRELHAKLAGARGALHALVREDAEAYKGVMSAMKMPRESSEDKSAREAAIEQATRLATEVPLRTSRIAAEVMVCLEALAGIGNPNARSDAAVGAQLACAALKGAQYNVLINLPGLKDTAFAAACRSEALELVRGAQAALQRIDALMGA